MRVQEVRTITSSLIYYMLYYTTRYSYVPALSLHHACMSYLRHNTEVTLTGLPTCVAMPLKNVHYQRLETEESDGEEDEAPPTHVELHSSHYVKGESRWGDSGLCFSP